jgi:hypothetical protein
MICNQCKNWENETFVMTYKSKVDICALFNRTPRHEDVLGSGGTAPLILDPGTRWRWVVSFTPRPLYPKGKSPWYPLDRRKGGPQSESGRGGEEKNSQPLSGLEPPIIQPVAQRYTTELSRLLLRPIKCPHPCDSSILFFFLFFSLRLFQASEFLFYLWIP